LTIPSLLLYLGPGPLSSLPLSILKFFTYRPKTAYNAPATTRKARIPIETPRPTVAAAVSPCDDFKEGVGSSGIDVVIVVVREGERVR
jgi:hypothetical protein